MYRELILKIMRVIGKIVKKLHRVNHAIEQLMNKKSGTMSRNEI